MTKHLWAFYYFCSRKGDRVVVDKRNDIVMIERKDD